MTDIEDTHVSDRKLKIAILGTRGIPASYGGFETFAEELSKGLVRRGHAVAVYCRRPFGKKYAGPSELQGVEIRVAPTLMFKYLETPVHALFSMLDLFKRQCDVVILCNAANSPFAWLVRLKRIPLLVNVDGIERKRLKWSFVGKLWYLLGEVCSILFATRIVADAKVISSYYRKQYGVETEVIAYGGRASKHPAGETLKTFGLEPDKYILYVSRLEPENNALGVIEAYMAIKPELPLVIVGDAPYAKKYIAKLHEISGDGVIFTGFQFGKSYQELQSNCFLYIQATQVGGTHPALVEAMAYGNCIIANGTEENVEVLGDAGLYFAKNDFRDLKRCLLELLAQPSKRETFRQLAKERAAKHYTWEQIVDKYESLFSEILPKKQLLEKSEEEQV